MRSVLIVKGFEEKGQKTYGLKQDRDGSWILKRDTVTIFVISVTLKGFSNLHFSLTYWTEPSTASIGAATFNFLPPFVTNYLTYMTKVKLLI